MNEQTDTPRTQSFRDHLIKISPKEKIWGLFKWSENLERELTAARAELEEYKNAFTEMNQALGVEVEEVERLKLELTAATKQRDGLKQAVDCASDLLASITDQRDRLAHELERITITGSADHCRKIADEALQSLTKNEL